MNLWNYLLNLLITIWRYLVAKLTLIQVAGGYESIQAINTNYGLIEAALENTLSRDGTTPNSMNAPLDMNGFGILNASALNIQDDSGASISDAIGYATEWSNNAEDALVSAAAGGDQVDDYSSLHHSTKASAQRVLSETAKTDAEAAQVAAEAAYDSFDDRYLGSKASAPTLDNDGNTLLDGAMYWNSTSADMWVYDLSGTSWGLIGSAQNSAGSVTIADAGTYYTSGNVEGALQEAGSDLVSQGSDITTNTADITTNTADIATNTAKIAGLNSKVINIGDWNMNTTGSMSVNHGLTLSKIRSVCVFVRNDTGTEMLSLDAAISISGLPDGSYHLSTLGVSMARVNSAYFDSLSFDSTSYNRGWITIQYID